MSVHVKVVAFERFAKQNITWRPSYSFIENIYLEITSKYVLDELNLIYNYRALASAIGQLKYKYYHSNILFK